MNLREQEEILRIKLLMGYNTKKTLSENYSRVIQEAPAPTSQPSFNAKLDPPKASGLGKKLPPPNYPEAPSNQLWYLTLFLNANPDEIAPGKKYNYLWLEFLNKVKGANLEALLDARNGALTYEVTIDGKKYSPYDLGIGGGITPDLPNFEGKAGNTGVATSVLDSTIFGLRLNDYYKKLKEWEKTPWQKNPYTGKNEFKRDSKGNFLFEPVAPQEPQWHLLNKATINTGGLTSQNTATVLNSVDANGKSANEIIDGYNKKESDEQFRKAIEDAPGKTCYFISNTDGDKFRGFVNDNFPELAQKKKKDGGLELDRVGKKSDSYCNSFINDAFNFSIKTSDPKINTIGKFYQSTLPEIYLYDKNKKYKPIEEIPAGSHSQYNLCYPFCQFTKEEIVTINKCFTKEDYHKYIEFLPTVDEKVEVFSLTLGACVGTGKLKQSEVDTLVKKFEKSFVIEKQQEVLKQEEKKASEQEKTELSQLFDMSKFPTKTGEAIVKLKPSSSRYGPSSGCAPWYWGTSPLFQGVGIVGDWIEPNTKIKVNIHCKTEAQVLDELIVLYKKKQKDEHTKELLKNPKMWKIFGYEKLMKASKDCPYKLDDFLLGIETGAIYDKETGLAYGTYTISPKDGRTPVIVKWPANENIPCESEFWEKYGDIIKWGGMAVSLVIPFVGGAVPLLAAISTRIFVSAAIDFGVNMMSAYYNEKAGRHEEAKMDVAIALISVAIDTIPNLSKTLAFGMDDWSEDLIVRTFRDKIKDGTIKSYDDLLKYTKTLSQTEQKVLRNVLDNPKLGEALQTLNGGNSTLKQITKAVDGRIAQITKQSKLGLFGETLFRNLSVKVPLTLSPMIPVYGPKLIAAFTGTYKAVYGQDPNKEILDKFIENYPKYFADLDYDEMAEELTDNPKSIQQVLDNEEYQRSYVDKQIKNAKVIVNGKEKDLTSEMQKQADILRKIDEEQKAYEEEQKNKTPQEIEDEKMVEEFEEETKVNLEKYKEGTEGGGRPVDN